VVHAETSTGVRNQIAPLRELQNTDTLLLVDAVTSLGGIPVEVDAWGVDACYSATQKCLGAPSGIAPVTLSERAVQRIRDRERPVCSFYLDLSLLDAYYQGDPARYHHTASSPLISSVHAGLGRLLAEGLAAVWERHARVGERLQARADPPQSDLGRLGLLCQKWAEAIAGVVDQMAPAWRPALLVAEKLER